MENTSPPPPTTTITTTITTTSPPPSTTTLPPPITNGVLKRHKPLNLHQPPPIIITYKECMKNHAASIGGHAVDGCCEFMPSPTSSPTYPTSLKCAACGCHRNFHRRDPEESLFPSPTTHVIEYQPHHRHHPPPPPPPPATGSPGNSPSPPPISSSYYPSAPHMLLALSSGVSTPLSENHHNNNISNNNMNNIIMPVGFSGDGSNNNNNNSSGKKRFRTKFSQGQKEKMHEMAERVGWKMQKRDEVMIMNVCNEIGIDKNVFKVWMHNNKSTIGNKKDFGDNIIINEKNENGNNNNCTGEGEGIDFIISRTNNNNNINHNLNLHHDVSVTGNNLHQQLHLHNNVICAKGSSSSC